MVTRERAVRPGPAWVRLLLLVSLLFGVAAMHTLGHPATGAHESAPADPVSSFVLSVAASAQTDPRTHHGSLSPVHAVPLAAVDAGPAASIDPHGPATDATSVCLAIVGMATALLGLTAAVLLPWPGLRPRPPAFPRRSVTRVATPSPPSLAQLQVLRV
ncbi:MULTISPECIES: hypothetical protein [unclassified Nocardiopsis]|uniref:hypothetical protein n=1 Tax=unclassified Nocardiopsis TaxID=2649073 RepID=UPI001F3048A8|nr:MULTISPECIES: hypothetical protein [unclassified Nocardiopsis]